MKQPPHRWPLASPLALAQPRRRRLDCMIQPHQIVQVGSAVPGVIDRILVERGDLVDAGPADRAAAGAGRARALAVARERAAQERRGEGRRQLARAGAARAAARAASCTSRTSSPRPTSTSSAPKRRWPVAAPTRRRSGASWRSARSSWPRRSSSSARIRAPIAGVVVERFMSPGEFVDQKPVLRLAAIDPLRVDVLVPAVAFGQVEPGMKGQVVPELLQPRRARGGW